MNIFKSILLTIIYIFLIELSGVWIFLVDIINLDFILDYHYLIQGVFQAIFILLFLKFIIKIDFSQINFKVSRKWYLIAISCGVIFVFLQSPLKWIYNIVFDADYSIDYKFDGFLKFTDVNIISTIFLIPIVEELYFRQYIQGSLQKDYNGIIAVGFTSLLFAIMHTPYITLFNDGYYFSFHLVYITFFGGLISGILFYKTKSILPSIIMHCSWNIFVTIT